MSLDSLKCHWSFKVKRFLPLFPYVGLALFILCYNFWFIKYIIKSHFFLFVRQSVCLLNPELYLEIREITISRIYVNSEKETSDFVFLSYQSC